MSVVAKIIKISFLCLGCSDLPADADNGDSREDEQANRTSEPNKSDAYHHRLLDEQMTLLRFYHTFFGDILGRA